MLVKISELKVDALAWSVAKIKGRTLKHNPMGPMGGHGWWIWEETPSGQGGIILSKSIYLQIGKDFSPASNWSQGGPIIEEQGIRLHQSHTGEWWAASTASPDRPVSGPTLLIAAMRCYITSVIGDTIEVPSQLI